MKYCQQCGKELAEGAKFCMECGTAVPAEPVEEKVTTESENLPEEKIEEVKEEAVETVEEPKVVEPVGANVSEQPQNASAGTQSTQQAQYQQTQGQQSQSQQTQYQQSQYQQTQYQQPAYDPRKSRTLAGILGIIFGCFGVHNFYLGYTAKAVIQLCVSILGLVLCCVGIGVIIITGIAIWGLVEGIMILAGSINVDGKGVPLRD